MFVNLTSIRVRYAETDQMAVVYYGNYPQYFEVGRVEALRSVGLSYKKMEEEGIMLPVLNLQIKYIGPAHYDELLKLRTVIKELPQSRIRFDHELYNEEGKLITIGMVELVFVNKATGRPCRCPNELLQALEPFFKGAIT
jgi:acyl-CoA thioester hydrolase